MSYNSYQFILNYYIIDYDHTILVRHTNNITVSYIFVFILSLFILLRCPIFSFIYVTVAVSVRLFHIICYNYNMKIFPTFISQSIVTLDISEIHLRL